MGNLRLMLFGAGNEGENLLVSSVGELDWVPEGTDRCREKGALNGKRNIQQLLTLVKFCTSAIVKCH